MQNASAKLGDGPALFALPDEVLIEIFHQYNVTSRKLPLCLTHLCARLRRLALAAPFLWSRLRITPQNIEQSQIILSRTGTCAALRIELSSGNPRNLPDRAIPLEWLRPYMPRIQELAFVGVNAFELPCFVVPNLKLLDIRLKTNGCGNLLDQPLEMPVLRELELDQSTPHCILKPLRLPFSQLTSLIIGGPRTPLVKSMPFILASVNLQTLDITCPASYEDTRRANEIASIPGSQVTTLPQLESLSLAIGPSASLIFSHITAPNLRRVSLSRVRGWLESFTAFAERSSCQITHFTMEECSPPGQRMDLTEDDWDGEMIALLRLVPTIQYFHAFDSGALGAPILRALTSTSGTSKQPVGPSLKVFSVINTGAFEYAAIPMYKLATALRGRLANDAVPEVWEERTKNFVVIHHDATRVDEEVLRARKLMSEYVGEVGGMIRYARHIVFCS